MAAAGQPPDRRPVHPGSTGRGPGRRLREWRQQPSSSAPVRRPRPTRLMTPEDYMDVTLIARDAHNEGGPDPRVFDSEQIPAADGALADLRVTVGGADLAAPPVVLPDFHHKSNMELPSSVAVATRTSIRPTLTSASVNCGMALIALNSPRPARAGNRRVLPARPRALPVPAGHEHGAVGPGCAGLCPRRRRVRGRTIRHRDVDARARRRAAGASTSTATTARTGSSANCPASCCSSPG